MRCGRSRAVLDGEICCLEPDGRSDFRKLLFRREWPYFYAFDLLAVDGRDLRRLALLERKARLVRDTSLVNLEVVPSGGRHGLQGDGGPGRPLGVAAPAHNARQRLLVAALHREDARAGIFDRREAGAADAAAVLVFRSCALQGNGEVGHRIQAAYRSWTSLAARMRGGLSRLDLPALSILRKGP
jgi:hypothetical protein